MPSRPLSIWTGLVRGETEVVAGGDGSPTREFLFVEDAAEGLVAADLLAFGRTTAAP